eukprot:CAMPEP_0174832064 /NCGR_PEP_ID=MMETSP1114-20130205/3468_1 /TAXON_ID=312471 /ORGANISM="Neobodo designis, Strain CCAP 1951/1" /LENGTH=218 /DNA_ID=CAMNT_0016065915 /DNA_START=108 /DNA_END=761 /DNA_ORIENTATION=+
MCTALYEAVFPGVSESAKLSMIRHLQRVDARGVSEDDFVRGVLMLKSHTWSSVDEIVHRCEVESNRQAREAAIQGNAVPVTSLEDELEARAQRIHELEYQLRTPQVTAAAANPPPPAPGTDEQIIRQLVMARWQRAQNVVNPPPSLITGQGLRPTAAVVTRTSVADVLSPRHSMTTPKRSETTPPASPPPKSRFTSVSRILALEKEATAALFVPAASP